MFTQLTALIAPYATPVLAFSTYLALAFVMTIVFSALYVRITPHKEISLIRSGNVAAAAQFGGVLIGYCIPLYSAISHSVSLTDFVVWGAVALVVQVVAFWIVSKVISGLSDSIVNGNTAVGITSGVVAFCAGIINAACMTY
jgi:putative membrane protein